MDNLYSQCIVYILFFFLDADILAHTKMSPNTWEKNRSYIQFHSVKTAHILERHGRRVLFCHSNHRAENQGCSHTDLHWDINVSNRWPLPACAVWFWHFTISTGAKCQPSVLVLGRFGLWEWYWFSPVRRFSTSSFSWIITRDLVWNHLPLLFIRGISSEH